MRNAALLCAVVLASGPPALALTWQVTNPHPQDTLAGAGVIPIQFEPDTLEIEIHKWWQQSFIPDGPGEGEVPIVIQFVKEAGDPDILHIIDEIIFNVSQHDWIDYHLLLLGSDGLPIEPEELDPEVWFFNYDATDNWQMIGGDHPFAMKVVTTLTVDPNKAVAFSFEDGSVPAGDFFGPQGPPTNQLVITNLYIDMSGLDAGQGFYLKQVPTIPEPATALLMMIPVVLHRRRRFRSQLIQGLGD